MFTSSSVMTEQVLIIAGLIIVHVAYGSYTVALGGIIDTGIHPLLVVLATSLSTFFVLAPFAVALEMSKWPKEISFCLLMKFYLVSLGGYTGYQTLTLVGIEKTTPAISSAMTNLSPGLIFLIAACLRLERVDMKCTYTWVKIIGTLICLIGVLATSFLQTSPTSPSSSSINDEISISTRNPSSDWITGSIILFVAVFMMSGALVIQASIIKELPAPLSVSAISAFFGAHLTQIVLFIMTEKWGTGSSSSSSSLTIQTLAAYGLTGGIVNGGCSSFLLWCTKKRGPVLVSMFSPIATVTAAFLTALTLGKVISLGSFAGIAIMFAGLYLVLWAKKNESNSVDTVDIRYSDDLVNVDIEKPLLC